MDGWSPALTGRICGRLRPVDENAVTLTLTLEDVAGCWHTGAAAEGFRDGQDPERFEVTGGTLLPEGIDADDPRAGADLIALPDMDGGSLLWCETYTDALLVAKVHQGLGHAAYVLWDTAPLNDSVKDSGYAVLTARSLDDEIS